MNKGKGFGAFVSSILDDVGYAINKNVKIQRKAIDIAELSNLDILTTETDIEILIHDKARIDVVLETYEGGPELITNHSNGHVKIVAMRPNTRTFAIILPLCKLQILVPINIAKSFRINTNSGDITMGRIVVDTLDVKLGSGDFSAHNLSAKVGKFEASSGDISIRESNVDELQFKTSSGDVELETISGNMIGSTSSGDVLIRNISGNELDVKTSSGTINAEYITVKSALFKTSSGNIDVNYLNVEKILTTTSSGNMKYSNFSGSIKGYASSGNVYLTLIEDSTIDMDTGSGNITVIIEKVNLNATLNICKKSGNIITNLPLNLDKYSNNWMRGILGNGEHSIRLSTRSGVVKMNKAI